MNPQQLVEFLSVTVCFVTVWLPSSSPLKRLVASRHQKRVSSIKLYSTVAVMLENVTSIEDAASDRGQSEPDQGLSKVKKRACFL